MTQHTVAIQQVQLILQGARHQGLPTAPLLQRAGIPPALLESPLARVSLAQYAQLIRVLRRSLRDELWGLCSQALPVGSFGHAATQLVQCQTLDQALRLGFRQYHGLLADFVPRLLVQGGVARVQLLRRCPAATPLNLRLDYAQKAFLLLAFGLACWLVARRVPVLGVDYTEPAPRSDSSRVYQAPIRHDQAHVGLRFDARWLDLPVVQSRQSLREFLAGAPANLLIKYRDPGSVSERIRRLLHQRLDAVDLSLDAVGAAMAMAPPTLRRRLRDEGHGFQALKDALRRDAAIACLARPELTLPEIAQRLGFSEASTFHRAFKKWTGVAPGAYRLTHLATLPADPLIPSPATGSP